MTGLIVTYKTGAELHRNPVIKQAVAIQVFSRLKMIPGSPLENKPDYHFITDDLMCAEPETGKVFFITPEQIVSVSIGETPEQTQEPTEPKIISLTNKNQ